MRTLAIAAALVAVAVPAVAEDVSWMLPEPGFYCPVSQNVMPISVGPDRGMGIDALDCEHVRLEGGMVRSASCVSNGGHRFPYETDLIVRPDGSLQHDGVVYRRQPGRPPCR